MIGHVDFTIEVERALRVLDGAILVLCAVAGVQVRFSGLGLRLEAHEVSRAKQQRLTGKCVGTTFLGYPSSTKWIGGCSLGNQDSFILMNSLCLLRPGANPWRIINQIRTKLRIPAAAVQVPIGVEEELSGVVDLVHWKAIYNQGVKGFVCSYEHLLR